MSKKKPIETPDLFVGSRLAAARTKAGISLEQAARDTRIRVQRLREIEADDFSGFEHPTYARLFLLDYAAYLGVPQDEIRPLLPDQTVAAIEGFQYLDALSGAPQPAPARSPGRRRRRRAILGTLATLIIALAVLIGVLSFISTVRKLERLKPVPGLREELAATPAPSPTPEPTPEPTATPEESPQEPGLWDMAAPEPTPALETTP